MAVLQIPCPNCGKELRVKDPSLLGKKAKCPACSHRFVLKWTAESDTDELPETTEFAAPFPDTPTSSSPVATTPDDGGLIPAINVTEGGGVDRLRDLKRRKRKRSQTTIVASVVFVALVAGGFYFLRPLLQSPPVEETASADNQQQSEEVSQQDESAPPQSADWAEGLSPTDGSPIDLRMVPSGVRLVINLRPAELWSNERQMAELRASLTADVANWIASELKRVCRHDPAQIEEVLLGWILGARGTEPDLVAVVRLVDEARMSDLLDQFGNTPIDEFAQPKVYQKDGLATLILDTKTFAIAPQEYATELPEWVETSNFNTSDGILELLPHTDRERQFTIIFEPADIPRHLGKLVPNEAARPLISQISDWFARDAETVCWSLHTSDAFHSEVLVRGPRLSSAAMIEENVKLRLKTLPEQLVANVRKMQPSRSGFRKMIGRLPAMVEVSRQATISSLEGKTVRLLTVMPPKAAPNLALASVLAWDESTRTDFSADAPAAIAQATPDTPETVLERLELPIDAEFNRDPLQDALAYIGGEIDVTIEIDGDALKDAGFTKNMAQTFNLGRVPASKALAHLIGQYDEPGKKMVIVIDEPKNTLLVLTQKFADQQGLTPHSFAE